MKYVEVAYKIMGEWQTQDTHPKQGATAEEIAFDIWTKIRFNTNQNATHIFIVDPDTDTKVLFDPTLSMYSLEDEDFENEFK